jgi:hypothetical protein
MLQPLRALGLKAGWGKLRITGEAMVLVISFHAHAVRNDIGQATQAASTDTANYVSSHSLAESPAAFPPVLVPALPTLNDRPSPAVVALGTTVALVSTYLLARLTFGLFTDGRRRHRFA